MEDQFISYELALKLKELGFKEECFGFYETLKKVGDGYCFNNYAMWGGISQNISESDDCNLYITTNELYGYYDNILRAPLYQQVFDWFREKGYDTTILRTPPEMVGKGVIKTYSYFIWKEDNNPRGVQEYKNTYEEARLACLKKLIEIYEQTRKNP